MPALEEAHNQYIPTHKWPPKSVRPELARMLTSLWQRLAENPGDESVWILESIFFRCILHAGQGPDLGDQWSNVKIIKERLRRWMAGECGQLWEEAKACQVERPVRGKKKRVDMSLE